MKINPKNPSKSEYFVVHQIFKDMKFRIFHISDLLLRDGPIRLPAIISILEVLQAIIFQFHPQVILLIEFILFMCL